jgi:hypothetical protein
MALRRRRTDCSGGRGSRPGCVPTIDLVVGYSKTNTSPILKLLLSRIDDLIARVAERTHWKRRRVTANPNRAMRLHEFSAPSRTALLTGPLPYQPPQSEVHLR